MVDALSRGGHRALFPFSFLSLGWVSYCDCFFYSDSFCMLLFMGWRNTAGVCSSRATEPGLSEYYKLTYDMDYCGLPCWLNDISVNSTVVSVVNEQLLVCYLTS